MSGKVTIKTALNALFVAILMIFATLLLCSCDGSLNDTSFQDEDYIEVKSLRINGPANINMSSSGEPSTYRLDVKTLPANATNKKLIYYIPSDYHQYLTVSDDGLLTAHKVSEDISIPVTIRSTTNTSAKISVSVKVEDVAVTNIKFAQEKISLLYNGESGKITPIYEPSHAIDGRNAVFTSLNEQICTVSNSGEVTPVGVGVTTVKATCSTRTGKLIENFISVEVAYASGQYQLDVSGSPNFNQVIGDFSAIDFTLLILGDNVDPSPKVSWYVDTERVASNEDKIQYTHTPSATTQITYHIYVYVTPYQGSTVTLESAPITVYRAFNGISLSYDNDSTVYKPYHYGDTVTFEIDSGDASATVTQYSWELSETSNPHRSEVIATTYPSDKNLTRRINVAGDYSLTAKWLDINGNLVNKTMFDFSSEKLFEGDVLVVRPTPTQFGLPPDSYHWYTVPCNEDGEYDASKKSLCEDTAFDEPYYHRLTKGTFRFLVTASIGGVAATVGGNSEPYLFVSDVIRVYNPTERDTSRDNDLIDTENPLHDVFAVKYHSAIEDVSIEGIGRDAYSVFLKWNNVEGSSSYIVEITHEDGTVSLCDSAEKSGNVFGSNFVYLSPDEVTLKDVFSVRIKQKNGLYSRSYNYGIPNAQGIGDETHILNYPETLYPYFCTIGLNNAHREYSVAEADIMNSPALNAYISDMEDLRDLIAFILLFRPSVNEYIEKTSIITDNVRYDCYSIDLYIPFRLTESEKPMYPCSLTEEQLASYGTFSTFAEMIYGAAASLPYGFDFSLSFENSAPGVTVTFCIPDASTVIKVTDTPKGKSTLSENFVIDKSDTVDSSYLPINRKKNVSVHNSDELVYAIELGYNPVPRDNDALSILFKKIKEIVVRITDVHSGDLEKIRAYYDYLATNTVIEPKIAEMEEDSSSDYELYLYAAYRLEGVFNNNQSASDVGIAKAFTVMCGVSGIPCHTVVADVNGKKRTLNKVCLQGKWYVVDIPSGMFVSDGYSVVSGNSFMLGEHEYSSKFASNQAVFYGGAPIAFDTYNNTVKLVSDNSELANLLNGLLTLGQGTYGIEVDFARSVFIDENAIKEALEGTTVRGIYIGKQLTITDKNSENIRVIVLVTVMPE